MKYFGTKKGGEIRDENSAYTQYFRAKGVALEGGFFAGAKQQNQPTGSLRDQAIAKFGAGLQLTPGVNPFGMKGAGVAPAPSPSPSFGTPGPAVVSSKAAPLMGSGFFGGGGNTGPGVSPFQQQGSMIAPPATPFGRGGGAPGPAAPPPSPSPFGGGGGGGLTGPGGPQRTFGSGGAPPGGNMFGANPNLPQTAPSTNPFGGANTSAQKGSFGSRSVAAGQNPFGAKVAPLGGGPRPPMQQQQNSFFGGTQPNFGNQQIQQSPVFGTPPPAPPSGGATMTFGGNAVNVGGSFGSGKAAPGQNPFGAVQTPPLGGGGPPAPGGVGGGPQAPTQESFRGGGPQPPPVFGAGGPAFGTGSTQSLAGGAAGQPHQTSQNRVFGLGQKPSFFNTPKFGGAPTAMQSFGGESNPNAARGGLQIMSAGTGQTVSNFGGPGNWAPPAGAVVPVFAPTFSQFGSGRVEAHPFGKKKVDISKDLLGDDDEDENAVASGGAAAAGPSTMGDGGQGSGAGGVAPPAIDPAEVAALETLKQLYSTPEFEPWKIPVEPPPPEVCV